MPPTQTTALRICTASAMEMPSMLRHFVARIEQSEIRELRVAPRLSLRSTRATSQELELSIPHLRPQRRQTDAGGIEPAVNAEYLARNVARALAGEKINCFRQFLFQAVAVERH